MDATFWGSIIGGLISGGLTLFGVWLTIRYYRQKDEKERLERERKEREARKMRMPNFEIIDYKTYDHYNKNDECDLELYFDKPRDVRNENGVVNFYYPDDVLDEKKYCSYVYELKNVGKTEVVNFTVYTTSKHYTCLIPIKELKTIVDEKYVSYSDLSDNKLKIGDTIKIKIIYNKERVLGNMLSASLNIACQDIFDTYWCQPLFAPFEKVYDANEITAEQYWSRQGEQDAIDCFSGKAFW